jgi:hypothetical protein
MLPAPGDGDDRGCGRLRDQPCLHRSGALVALAAEHGIEIVGPGLTLDDYGQ